MSAEPIYVVVCDNDVPHPRWGLDPAGPLVYETYTRNATLEEARWRVKAQSRWGKCRIARLVFLDEEAAEASQVLHVGGQPVAPSTANTEGTAQ